jgi:hypothetical protein
MGDAEHWTAPIPDRWHNITSSFARERFAVVLHKPIHMYSLSGSSARVKISKAPFGATSDLMPGLVFDTRFDDRDSSAERLDLKEMSALPIASDSFTGRISRRPRSADISSSAERSIISIPTGFRTRMRTEMSALHAPVLLAGPFRACFFRADLTDVRA